MPNRVHDGALARAIALLAAETSIIAVGTGAQPALGATQLTAELTRKTADVSTVVGAKMTRRVTFNESEANGAIREIGLIGNTLIASAASLDNKSAAQSLTVQFEIEAVTDNV